MYKFFKLTQDNWILDQNPDRNYGYDEILEVGKFYINGDKYIKRMLIEFSTSEVTSFISASNISDFNLSLEMTIASASLNTDQFQLNVHPISSSWTGGTLTSFDYSTVYNRGSSWLYKDYVTNLLWTEPGGDFHSDIVSIVLDDNGESLVTENYEDLLAVIYESQYANPFISEYDYFDMTVNLNTLYAYWEVENRYDNYGLIIKFADELESDTIDYGEIKFFSRETNSSYYPVVKISWDDSMWQTGSLSEIDSEDILIYSNNLKSRINTDSENINIKLLIKKLRQELTFNSIATSGTVYNLPNDSWYSIVDVNTGKIIIPFSTHSKVSCNASGNFIKINTSVLNKWCRYSLLIKTAINGNAYIYNVGMINT